MFSLGIDDALAVSITAALLRGNGDFANQLRKDRTTLRVGRGLVVLDLLPFTVASHVTKPV
jgi:hypothetical protein